MTPCPTHRSTFPTRFLVREFVEKSRIFEVFWKCPTCARWVAGHLEEAPVTELTPRSGIFYAHER